MAAALRPLSEPSSSPSRFHSKIRPCCLCRSIPLSYMESTTHASPPIVRILHFSDHQLAVFEVFPLVYPVYYGISLGQMGLVFLCVLIACILGVIAYSICLYFLGRSGFATQERRLLPALGFCFWAYNRAFHVCLDSQTFHSLDCTHHWNYHIWSQCLCCFPMSLHLHSA